MVRPHRKGVRQSSYAFEYRITILGSAKTGKTSLVDQFVNGRFSTKYRPTVEDHLTHIVQHNGNTCVCLFVDTSGSNDFPAMRRLSIVKGNACIVVYSVADRRSFEAAKRIVDEVKSLKDPSEDVKIILVGNKADLKRKRVVDYAEGEMYSQEINVGNVSSAFYETAAIETDQVENMFRGLLSMFLPEEVVLPDIPERSTFARMSLRRKSRKSVVRKQKTDEYFSDSEILDGPLKTPPQKRRSRINSADRLPVSEDESDSVVSQQSSSQDSSPKSNLPTGFKRQNSAKQMLHKAFGSMQRLFKPDHKNSLSRVNTYESIKHVGRVTTM